MNQPTPAQIRRTRTKAELSQAAAAALIYCSTRAWEDWEAGRRTMHPAFLELFRLKSRLLRARR
jgi:DNA-binding transcriptional regulator YiaG